MLFASTFADKPPIEELDQFLEFQLPRQWAPAYGDLPLAPRRKKNPTPSLQFTFLGPRLYVNTVKVKNLHILVNACSGGNFNPFTYNKSIWGMFYISNRSYKLY